jgi:uncharacterized membrane protein YdbT with pleckstrin-like domain
MLCRQCSAALQPGSAFCNRCGAGQAEASSGTVPMAGAAAPEKSLWKGRYSLRAATHLWILSAFWMALVIALYLRFIGTRTQQYDAIALAAGLAPGVLALGRALIRGLSLSYRLTSHRLFRDRGILSRQLDELELIRVDDISVSQTFLQRLFGVGMVKLLSTDPSTPELVMEGIARPLEVKELLRSQVQARRSRTTFMESL